MPQLVTRWHPWIRLNRLIGLSLIATLVLIALSSIFTLTPSAHAQSQVPSNQVKSQLITTNFSNPRSGGGCWSYDTWSNDATAVSNGTPQMYGIDGSDGPSLGLAYNSCENIIQVTISPSGYDYYKVHWWRPGLSGWTQYTTGNSVSNLTNAHYGTYYEFSADACTSHWYGDSCTSWSAHVYINTDI